MIKLNIAMEIVFTKMTIKTIIVTFVDSLNPRFIILNAMPDSVQIGMKIPYGDTRQVFPFLIIFHAIFLLYHSC